MSQKENGSPNEETSEVLLGVQFLSDFILNIAFHDLNILIIKPLLCCVNGKVDAFTDRAFKGNPAAVCLLEEDNDDEKDVGWMQSVASEFNVPDTCFLTPIGGAELPPTFRIRWFTPVAEVEICGHATIAASHFLFSYGLVISDKIEFLTAAGVLTAKKILIGTSASNYVDCQSGDSQKHYYIELDFPVIPIVEFNSLDITDISKCLNGAPVIEVHKTTTAGDLFVLLPSGKAVAEVEPQFDEIKRCPGRGIIVTGPAPPESGFDFYSRFFVPKLGVNEDHVCGSAHCALAPFWSKRLGKFDFVAYQASQRSGVLNVHFDEKNQRVLLRGKAVVVAEGFILV